MTTDSDTMRPTGDDVDTYLRSAKRSTELLQLDELITGSIPDASRTLWRGVMWGGTQQTIVGYGVITQPRPRGRSVDWFLLGLAEQTRYISVYVNAVEDNQYLVSAYENRLGRVKVGTASIAITDLKTIDLDVMRELVAHAAQVTR
ncbi:DUF1801 domain-containing protein [Jonesia quinghaiensis]|uniref:DUF1801 domain-containing protein n=1 Tax=Jonesia quinghaiensis TaxID=262806 RepID=UPI000417B5AC|nr:DUF1801 domain-containing protein [Jonesia quinghaiensis]